MKRTECGTVAGSGPMRTDEQLADMEHSYQSDDRVLAAVAEIRQSRQLLTKISVSELTMNVNTVGFYRFEMPWAFDEGEERLTVAEVIRRHFKRGS